MVMTHDGRERPDVAVSRRMERDEVRTAIARSSSTETIGRRLGDDLIAAGREVVAAYYAPFSSGRAARLCNAIVKLERLVGRPHE